MFKNNSKTKIICIVVGLLFIIILVGIFLKLFVLDDYYLNESDYADDSSSELYQNYDQSKTKFYVYGQTKDDSVISMTMECGDDKKIVELSSDATEVDNHCILSFAKTLWGSWYLDAYIVTPDGSLITLTTEDSPSLQVNAYKKETRIVLNNGYFYSRITNQDKKKFTIQIADKIYETTTGGIVGIDTKEIDAKSGNDLFYGNYIINSDDYDDQLSSDNIFGIALFQIIDGSFKIKDRSTGKYLELNDYLKFAYMKNSTYTSLVFNNDEDYFDNYGIISDDYNDFVNVEQDLDDTYFTGIAKKSITLKSVNDIMKSYFEYYSNKNSTTTTTKSEGTTTKSNLSGCDQWDEATGIEATWVCWCRNDISFHGEVPNGYSASDLVYCQYESPDLVEGSINGVGEGFISKDCAEELGWPRDSYSNEGGWTCN